MKTRSCREFVEQYNDAGVNCATCVKWDRIEKRCKDEEGVVARYENTEVFDIHDRMMRTNKGVYLD